MSFLSLHFVWFSLLGSLYLYSVRWLRTRASQTDANAGMCMLSWNNRTKCELYWRNMRRHFSVMGRSKLGFFSWNRRCCGPVLCDYTFNLWLEDSVWEETEPQNTSGLVPAQQKNPKPPHPNVAVPAESSRWCTNIMIAPQLLEMRVKKKVGMAMVSTVWTQRERKIGYESIRRW